MYFCGQGGNLATCQWLSMINSNYASLVIFMSSPTGSVAHSGPSPRILLLAH
jgi:hypothetical protein